VKLSRLDQWNARREAQAARYSCELTQRGLTVPQVPSWATPVWHLYVVRSPRRDDLQAALTRDRIGTMIHYPVPPHAQPAYRDAGFAPDAFPIARALANESLSLPIGPHLTSEQHARVIAAVNAHADR
jgi:dTDP-4-amino-4,6-dideoxygalactose transaminase